MATIAAKQTRYKWYRYTDDSGGHFAVKEETTWGDNADSGLAAFNAADPVWRKGGRWSPRSITLQDATTGRTITRTVGTVTATAWTTAGYTLDVNVIGLEDAVTYTKLKNKGESKRPVGAVYNAPQPEEAA